eukprot:gene31940-42615_t
MAVDRGAQRQSQQDRQAPQRARAARRDPGAGAVRSRRGYPLHRRAAQGQARAQCRRHLRSVRHQRAHHALRQGHLARCDGADRRSDQPHAVRAGRCVPGAARTAHAVGAARPSPALRPGDGPLAGRATGSLRRPASRAGKPSRPCHLEARLHRRLRPVQHCPEGRAPEGRRRPARHRPAVRHGLFLGRLREPCHSVRLCNLPHRDDLVAGRPDTAAAHRPGERRRSQGRSGPRLRGLQRGV